MQQRVQQRAIVELTPLSTGAYEVTRAGRKEGVVVGGGPAASNSPSRSHERAWCDPLWEGHTGRFTTTGVDGKGVEIEDLPIFPIFKGQLKNLVSKSTFQEFTPSDIDKIKPMIVLALGGIPTLRMYPNQNRVVTKSADLMDLRFFIRFTAKAFKTLTKSGCHREKCFIIARDTAPVRRISDESERRLQSYTEPEWEVDVSRAKNPLFYWFKKKGWSWSAGEIEKITDVECYHQGNNMSLLKPTKFFPLYPGAKSGIVNNKIVYRNLYVGDWLIRNNTGCNSCRMGSRNKI